MFTGLQGVEHAELRGHRTGAERSRPLCSDILFRGCCFLLPSVSPNTSVVTHTHTS